MFTFVIQAGPYGSYRGCYQTRELAERAAAVLGMRVVGDWQDEAGEMECFIVQDRIAGT